MLDWAGLGKLNKAFSANAVDLQSEKSDSANAENLEHGKEDA